MKTLNSKTMRKLLEKGVKLAKKMKQPKEGLMFSLFTVEKKNGWYYQVDFINRFDKPFVAVYAFKPPRVYYAKSAEYCLYKDI